MNNIFETFYPGKEISLPFIIESVEVSKDPNGEDQVQVKLRGFESIYIKKKREIEDHYDHNKLLHVIESYEPIDDFVYLEGNIDFFSRFKPCHYVPVETGKEAHDDILDEDLSDMFFRAGFKDAEANRIARLLSMRGQVKTLRVLTEKTRKDLRLIRGFGKHAEEVTDNVLKYYNLTLKGEENNGSN